mmetsp:Transcript_14446/g.32822  ORF Transcript_14446/g.32822 Transcript_14446/m.32822 type:complete len:174 (-) Transcript_14446:42-563(-)
MSVVGEPVVVNASDEKADATLPSLGESSPRPCSFMAANCVGGFLLAIGAIKMLPAFLNTFIGFDPAVLRVLRATPIVGIAALLLLLLLLGMLCRSDRLPKGCDCCCSCGCPFVPLGILVLGIQEAVFAAIWFNESTDSDDNVRTYATCIYALLMILTSASWLFGLARRQQFCK